MVGSHNSRLATVIYISFVKNISGVAFGGVFTDGVFEGNLMIFTACRH